MKWPWIAAGVWCALPVPHAAAYQSPARFIAPAAEGGGGGRFFSGSPSDSLTCNVCHGDAPPAEVQILGLPEAGYVPGQTYRIVVDWADSLESVALNLEVTDSEGHSFGTLSAPPMEQLTAADLCQSTGTPDVLVGTSERQLALVTECGGHQASLLWQAPSAPAADGSVSAWLNGSLVAADGDGTVDGDAVTNIQHLLVPARAGKPIASEIVANCAVLPGRAASRSSWFGCGTLLLWFALRRRRTAR